MPRITRKTVIPFIDEIVKELGYEVKENGIVPTRFTADQYQGGATKMYICVKGIKNPEHEWTIYSVYGLGELNNVLNDGFKLRLIKDNINQMWLTV